MDPSEVEIQADSAGSGRPEAVASGIPEHRRTQEVLRRSQEELQSVLASIPDYLWSADIDSQGHVAYRYHSPGVEKITGRPPDFYMLGPERWLSTVHPDDMPKIQKALQAIMTGHLPQLTEEYRIILPDGTVRWVRDNVQMRRQEGSTRLDGVVSDITERKETEDALRLSEASLKEALLAAQMGAWEWTAADGTLTWDENFYRIAGRDPKSLVPGDLEQAKMFVPESWERLKVAGENALVTGIPFDLDLELIRPDGSKRWLIGRGKPRRDALSRITHLRGTVQDITERKQVEEALRESEERYRQLFEVESDAILVVEVDSGRILDVNAAALSVYGYSREEFLGLAVGHISAEPEKTRATIAGRLTQVQLRWHRKKDGTLFPVEITGNYFVSQGCNIHVAAIRDITERKRAEEERQRSFDQLRALAAHLQSIREEERKRVAREIHDQLGQALTAIRIDLSSLIRELPSGDKPPSKRTSSILQLVDESIRVVRRISTELRPGILDDLGLVAALEWAGEDFQSRTGTTCRLRLPQDAIAVGAEQATAIFRIFQETLTNVARHADASAVEVRLAAEHGGLMLEVYDDGKGIPKDKLGASKSLGILGMRERAMLLGGELTIEGIPENGTTVRVRIPGLYPTRGDQAHD